MAILPKDSTRGFTLIELMVTLTIIGLVSGVAVWTLPAKSTLARDEAEQLAAILKHTADESLLSGNIMGVSLRPDGYSVHLFRRGAWLPVTDMRTFSAHQLDEAIALELVRDGTELVLGDQEKGNDPSFARPNIVFYPSGISPEFSVSVSSAAGAYRVTSDSSGEIRTVNVNAM